MKWYGGAGLRIPPYHAIEVVNRRGGAPEVWVHGESTGIAISMTHDAGMAIAVVAVATRSATLTKTLSSIAEVRARDAPVIAVVTEGDTTVDAELARDMVRVPESSELISPLINVVPLQLFAYHVAVERGCDVDQPRNLAKSVTVE